MPILMDHQNRLQRPSGLSSLMRPLCYSMACISRSGLKLAEFTNLLGMLMYAIVGRCNVPEPSSWHAIEKSKWKSSWDGLGNMVPAEAMRLFVKILEEEESGWYSRVSNFVLEPEPILDVQINNGPKIEPIIENGNLIPETKNISTENGSPPESQEKDVLVEGLGSIVVYD
ncbi:acyl-CoA-binding domain-containing protein 4 [Cucumis melo var. makuwa]|uniref:Acyl-CoA-binding domain-containing protein 4 n=1 Tax=Cucumis melo var. makuwa TaxID=1194695 RepID=A0A5A7SVM4_CUCMM|nr:acyl-CoA-binding domain-containing protein 4 [Cucumis melo var. makuwa]